MRTMGRGCNYRSRVGGRLPYMCCVWERSCKDKSCDISQSLREVARLKIDVLARKGHQMAENPKNFMQ